jgi:hypothetical protein
MFLLTIRSIVDRGTDKSVEEKKRDLPPPETGIQVAATAAGNGCLATGTMEGANQMKKCSVMILAAIAGLTLTGAAQAGSVVIDAVGGPIMIKSGDLPSLFTDGGLHDFTSVENKALCDTLRADGVTTDGLVTFLLADTSDGLSFITLVDDANVGGDQGNPNLIGMSTTAPSSTEYWINDLGYDILDISDPFNITTTASGTFDWFDNRGDGFAWSNLQDGDGVTFSFERMEGEALVAEDTFQFVTWDGDAWQVVDTANWTEDGQFAFSFVTIVPLPAPLLLGLAGLAGVAAYRRRKLA